MAWMLTYNCVFMLPDAQKHISLKFYSFQHTVVTGVLIHTVSAGQYY